MKKHIVSLLLTSVVSTSVYAATNTLVWGEAKKVLPQYPQSQAVKSFAMAPKKQESDYKLELINDAKSSSTHRRYQITYKGIPIWGYQIIYHGKKGSKQTVTGINVEGIEKEVTATSGKYSPEQIEKKILKSEYNPAKFKNSKKVIFIDQNDKAHLAYHFSYYSNSTSAPIKAPNYIVDANTSEILKEWDEVRSEKIGQGMGGNAVKLPYRAGLFQHGTALPGLPSLGKFDVTVKEGVCSVENESIKVMSLQNLDLGYEVFPVTTMAEKFLKLGAFSYPCSESSLYLNYADGSSGPINYAFSPVNDTMYFAQQTLDMYEKLYGVVKPIGEDLPLRAYTHLGDMDNAFAIPTIRDGNTVLAHQQVVIGNGGTFLTAPAQSVLAHELSHNFTAIHSGLMYEGQAGGINEAFSDMAAIALQDYIRQDHPWYWDGLDWTIGREALKNGQPMRYMDDPTKDGRSIGSAKDFTAALDVHLTSGIFNKAFYLLAHKPNWSVQKAFQIMVDANMHYWSPIVTYDVAACGVVQAALDKGYDKESVAAAFEEVGVTCTANQG